MELRAIECWLNSRALFSSHANPSVYCSGILCNPFTRIIIAVASTYYNCKCTCRRPQLRPPLPPAVHPKKKSQRAKRWQGGDGE